MHRNPVWRMKQKEVSRSLKRSRLKERNLESGQKGRRRGKGEQERRENKDNAHVCVLFVTVAFQRTVGLCACVCVQVCFYVLISFSIQPICGIDPLPNSEQNKSQPNPTIIYYTDGREREREGGGLGEIIQQYRPAKPSDREMRGR